MVRNSHHENTKWGKHEIGRRFPFVFPHFRDRSWIDRLYPSLTRLTLARVRIHSAIITSGVSRTFGLRLLCFRK